MAEPSVVTLQPTASEAKSKPAPSKSAARCAPLDWTYLPAPSNVDSNLLILLHGLGDSDKSFASLGAKLQRNVPQTAVLCLRGGHAVPFMENTAWGYWDVWDQYGQDIAKPDPSGFLATFSALLDQLTKAPSEGGCGWRSSSIHLLGFAHGATAAMEGVIAWTRKQRAVSTDAELGSIVSVSGELISHPTFSPPLQSPLLAFERRQQSAVEAQKRSLQRAFAHVEVAVFTARPDPLNGQAGSDATSASMPSSQAEWDSIMRFWARRFRNRSAWEINGALHEVQR